MSYSKSDFDQIIAKIEQCLYQTDEYPISCRLHDITGRIGFDTAKMKDGTSVDHVAVACNLASSIDSVLTLLKLAKDDDDTSVLSRVLVRELGSLREAFQDAEEEQIVYEKQVLGRAKVPGFSAKQSEKSIKLWADILKHPASTIVAHQCFSESDQAECTIDTARMRILEREMQKFKSDPEVGGNASKAWRKVWKQYSGKTVQFDLPTVDEIIEFVNASAGRLQNLIDRNKRIAEGTKV